jgi:hypothetical protein
MNITITILDIITEKKTSFIYWVQLRRFDLKTETKSSLRDVKFQTKYRMIDMSRIVIVIKDRLCGLSVRVPGYRSRGSGSIPSATRLSEK